jgi:hypothetical protein
MTKTGLLQALKAFSEETVKDLMLPVRRQREDEDTPAARAAQVYMARLPDMKASDKKAPYIVHSIITGRDTQVPGEQVACTVTVRSVLCVYHEDEQEGGLALLNLTERLRIEMLRRVVIDLYELDMNQGIELLIYPDDTAPYYLAEMVTVWKLPPIKREVKELWP